MTRKNSNTYKAIMNRTATAILAAAALLLSGCAGQPADLTPASYEAPSIEFTYHLSVPESEPRPLDKPVADAVNETLEVSAASVSSKKPPSASVYEIAKLADAVGQYAAHNWLNTKEGKSTRHLNLLDVDS